MVWYRLGLGLLRYVAQFNCSIKIIVCREIAGGRLDFDIIDEARVIMLLFNWILIGLEPHSDTLC